MKRMDIKLINRDDVIDAWCERVPEEDREDFRRVIRNLPTVDSRPKGKWIIKPMETICSECNMSFSTEIHYLNWEMGDPNYCPNCGAYERGEVDALKIGVGEE